MRVVHLCTSDRGGAGIAAARLHHSLVNKGIDSWFLTGYQFTAGLPNHVRFREEDVYNFNVFKRIQSLQYKIFRRFNLIQSPEKRYADKYLAGRPEGFEYFSFPFSRNHIEDHPLTRSADIIHLHWVSEGFLNYPTFFSEGNRKIVWTLHDMNPFTGGCHNSDGCLKFSDECRPCPQLKNTVDDTLAGKMLVLKERLVEQSTKGRIRIVTPSHWLKNLSAQSRLFGKYPHHVIPNGVDNGTFLVRDKAGVRQELGIPPDKKIILFVSNEVTNKRKGIDYLVEALNKIDESDLLLCTVGKKPLDQNLVKHPLLHFEFVTDDELMAKIYSSADVFVLPSIAENFPNTTCEALFCGVPVVAFRVGGIGEQVNESNGILVEPYDVSKLAKAIQLVLAEPGSFNRESISAGVVEKFSWEKVSGYCMDVYKDLMN